MYRTWCVHSLGTSPFSHFWNVHPPNKRHVFHAKNQSLPKATTELFIFVSTFYDGSSLLLSKCLSMVWGWVSQALSWLLALTLSRNAHKLPTSQIASAGKFYTPPSRGGAAPTKVPGQMRTPDLLHQINWPLVISLGKLVKPWFQSGTRSLRLCARQHPW